jgi:hypothetical protein
LNLQFPQNRKRTLIYLCFFVVLEKTGVPGVLMWIGILSVAFVAMGFLFFGLDKLEKT